VPGLEDEQLFTRQAVDQTFDLVDAADVVLLGPGTVDGRRKQPSERGARASRPVK